MKKVLVLIVLGMFLVPAMAVGQQKGSSPEQQALFWEKAYLKTRLGALELREKYNLLLTQSQQLTADKIKLLEIVKELKQAGVEVKEDVEKQE